MVVGQMAQSAMVAADAKPIMARWNRAQWNNGAGRELVRAN